MRWIQHQTKTWLDFTVGCDETEVVILTAASIAGSLLFDVYLVDGYSAGHIDGQAGNAALIGWRFFQVDFHPFVVAPTDAGAC